MKKLLLLTSMLTVAFLNAQNYYGSEFIGTSGVNNPLGVTKVGSNIVMNGLIGGDLTGAFPISFKGGNADGILTKLSSTDGTIQWIKQFGGGLDEVVTDVTMDATGNYYLTGYFMGAGPLAMDADPGPAVYPLSVISPFANRDIFIIKLDSNGDFLWAKQMSSPSGAANDDASTIKLDSMGNIYLAGSYVYVDFDPGAADQIYTATGSTDGFIVKLDNDGNFIWVKTFEGTSNKKVMDMEIDANDNIFVTGRFQGTIDLNPSSTETDSHTTAGSFDTFVAKLTSTGDFVWGYAYGGTGSDTVEKILVKNNKVYVGGGFSKTVDLDPTAGVHEYTAAGGTGQDAYLTAYNEDGTYITSFVIPGTTSNSDTIKDILIDTTGNFILTGLFQNMTIGGNNYAASATNSDNFYLKLDSALNFVGIYLVQGSNIRSVPFVIDLPQSRFVAIGSSKGGAAFDYTNPANVMSPSIAQYYTYLTKFDFEPTALSTQEQSANAKIAIYPNPAVNEVNLKSRNSINAVSIFNMEGRKVYSNVGSNLKKLNVSMLPSGVYLLQSTDAKGTTQQTKLIKK